MKRQVFSNLSATAAMLASLALAPCNQNAWAVGQEAEDQAETVGDREEPQDKQELREFQNRGDIQPLPSRVLDCPSEVPLTSASSIEMTPSLISRVTAKRLNAEDGR